MQVERIWAQSEITDFIIGSVHGINITDRDIKSLQGNQWLTDRSFPLSLPVNAPSFTKILEA